MSRSNGNNTPHDSDSTGTDTPNDIQPERRTQATFWDALKSLSPRDFQTIHKIPCAREAFLAGIGAGFAFGGVKLIMKGTISSAANWAVGTFCGTSVVVYEACHIRRYKERVGVQRAVEVMERQARRKGKDTPPLAQPEVAKLEEDEVVVVLPGGPQVDRPPSMKEVTLTVAVPPGVHGGDSRTCGNGGDGEEGKQKKSWYRLW